MLIPFLGVTTIIFIVAGLVGLLAVLMGAYKLVGAGWVGILVLLYILSGGESFSQSIFPLSIEGVNILYSTDTKYSHLEVRESLHGKKTERSLVMDSLVHNRYNPMNPDDLLYEYEQVFASLTEHFVQNVIGNNKFHTLTLGGGACLFPSYLERLYPASWNEVVEIDPEVVRVAQVYFDVSDDTRLRIITADARNFVDYVAMGNRNYDLIFLDAFNSFSIPYHLTTTEFLENVSLIMSPNGLVAANCIDIFSIGKFLNAYINTMESVFPHVYVFEETGTSHTARSTFVVVGSFNSLKIDVLYDSENRKIAFKMPDEQLEELHSRNGYLVLSDNHAPVEKLIGPVYLEHIK